MPLELGHIWDWFQELHIARSGNGFGPNPITFSDVAAWVSLTGVAIRASEVRVILMLDRLWLVAQAESRKAQQTWQDQQRQQRSRQNGR